MLRSNLKKKLERRKKLKKKHNSESEEDIVDISDSDEVVEISDSDEVVDISDSDEVVAISDSDEVVAISDSDEVVEISDSDEDDIVEIDDSDESDVVEFSSSEEDDSNERSKTVPAGRSVPRIEISLKSSAYSKRKKRQDEKDSTIETLRESNDKKKGSVNEEFDFGNHSCYWNENFQKVLNKVNGIAKMKNLNYRDREHMWHDLASISMDFEYSAKTYGRIIISEVYVDAKDKTIKPMNIGGVAGGEKYLVNDIIFKFALDSGDLFEGDELSTYKLAGQDLLCLNAYSDICHPKAKSKEDLSIPVCFPLCCIVDYRGFRLVAISLLPISGEASLVYGSCNAGEEVVCSDPTAEDLLKKCARRLNLSDHYVAEVGGNKFRAQTLSCCADLETHLGSDGQYYILDYARGMPPEDPKYRPDVLNRHLILKLRPEFVRLYETPLDPDAYSSFVRFPPVSAYGETDEVTEQRSLLLASRRKGEKDVRSATKFLLETHIPMVAENLVHHTVHLGTKEKRIILEQWLTVFIHYYGVNMRWIGHLRNQMLDESNEEIHLWRFFLMVEMLSRVLKHQLNLELRNQVQVSGKHFGEQPYIKAVSRFLNLVFGGGKSSLLYWKNKIPKLLEQNFPRVLENDLDDKKDLRKYIVEFTSSLTSEETDLPVSGICILFANLADKAGLSFRGHQEFITNPQLFAVDKPFNVNDLNHLNEKVKRTEIIGHSQGVILKMQASSSKHRGKYTSNLLEQSLLYFRQSLQAIPRNQRTLRNVGDVMLKLKFESLAGIFYELAIQCDEKDTISLYKYAYYLHHSVKDYNLAEEYYVKSNSVHLNIGNMLAYSKFLTDQARMDDAHRMYLNAVSNFPRNPMAHHNLALFLVEIEKFDTALFHFEQTMELNPDDPTVVNDLANLLISTEMDIDRGTKLKEKHEKMLKRSNSEMHVSFRLQTSNKETLHRKKIEKKSVTVKDKNQKSLGINLGRSLHKSSNPSRKT